MGHLPSPSLISTDYVTTWVYYGILNAGNVGNGQSYHHHEPLDLSASSHCKFTVMGPFDLKTACYVLFICGGFLKIGVQYGTVLRLPKHTILIPFSITKLPFWGSPIYGDPMNPPICVLLLRAKPGFSLTLLIQWSERIHILCVHAFIVVYSNYITIIYYIILYYIIFILYLYYIYIILLISYYMIKLS